MTNYILLEGFEMYAAIFLAGLMILIALIGCYAAIYDQDKIKKLEKQLRIERQKNLDLNRENLWLRLKRGEFEVGGK